MMVTTRRKLSRTNSAMKTYVIAASTIAAAASPAAVIAATTDFSAFVAPVTINTPPNTPRRPSQHWNVVTPICATKSCSAKHNQDGEDADSTTKKKKKRKERPTTKISKPAPPSSRITTTQSFGAVTATTYKTHGKQVDPDATPVNIHTLILGTHPGIQSLVKCQYYGHPMK
jgi:hypothetical protein